MHDQAQASGLPFPPVLRPELFDARGMPDWHVPVRNAKPWPLVPLVLGCAIAFGAVLLFAFAMPHTRTHRLEAQAERLPCAEAAEVCLAMIRLRSALPSHVGAPAAGSVALVSSMTGAPSRLRVLEVQSVLRQPPSLRVAWSRHEPLRAGKVLVAVDETRTLMGWIAPRLVAGHAERRP